jgi:hypothetical protein
VLEIVEQQQEPPAPQRARQALHQRFAPSLAHPERAGERGNDQGLVAERGEVDEDDALGKGVRQPGRDHQRQPASPAS